MTFRRTSISSRVRRACWALLAACIVSWPVSARPADAPAAVVIPASSSPGLRSIEDGFADWVERRLRAAGVPLRPGSDVRPAVAAARAKAQGRDPGTRELLAIAAALGVDRAVLIDLDFEDGRIDVLMRVHATERGSLLGAGRSAGPATSMAASATVAVERILPALGAGDVRAPGLSPFELGQLGARSRALRLLDAGELAAAWAAIANDTSPDGEAVRATIDRASEAVDVAREERMRLMAQRGQAEAAWREILVEASENLYADSPDPVILRTAADVQLARGKLHEAQAYYERTVEVSPEDADAYLGLGQTRAGQLDPRGARDAYRQAQALAPGSPRAAELLAAMPAENAKLGARAHLEASEEATRQLDPRLALHHLEQAVSLDPTLRPEARERAGRVQLDFGEPAAAMQSYRSAIEEGGSTAPRQRGLARSLRELNDGAGAELAYKEALELERSDPVTLRELGELYAVTERPAESRQLLEQAVSLAPEDPEAHRSLARTLHQQGELEQAAEHLGTAEELGGPDVDGLRALAAVQRDMGRPEAAQETLERAIQLEPTSVTAREELAAVYRDQGREQDAARQLELVSMLGGTEAIQAARGGMASDGPKDGPSQQLDALVTSFGLPMPGDDRTVLLGVREPQDWKSRVFRLFWPRSLDLELLEQRLGASIDPHYDRIRKPVMDRFTADQAQLLFDFDDESALDAGIIAAVNASLQTGSTFVAVAQRGTPLVPSPCPDPGQLFLELRRLSGATVTGVGILANQACIDDGVAGFSSWNFAAAGLILPIVLLLAFPAIRGFGRILVRVNLPDNTTALFSVSLTRRPRKVKATRERPDADAKGRFNQRLRALGKKERPLRKGRDIVFGWVPARSTEYYVTVHGPLYHSLSEQLIGDFLEERTVRVKRGRTATVQFDMKPKDCPVEVMVYTGNDVVNGAHVAVRGNRASSRYTAGGSAFLYLEKGEHVIVAGARDRVAERTIRIESYDPLPIVIDLAADGGLVFKGCPEAVAPFMEEDFDAAASALQAHGEARTALLMRARAHQQRGEVEEASRMLEQAGQLAEAADLLAQTQLDSGASASLYEEAGEFARAAEVHLASGDLLAAARAYEAGYDYANAIDCYRQLGDHVKLMELLEKTADHFEAGKLALELGETGHAIKNLQQVERRHPFYSEACRELGVLLAEQGSTDFALEKFDEAAETGGIESFPIELLDRYGTLLEESGRLDDAVKALSAVRRKDVGYANVDERIQRLKQQLTHMRETRVAGGATVAAATEVAPGTQALSTRYEILGELGAGGMGVVYKAKDKHLGRLVALKKLPDNLKAHPAAVKFFEREARSAAALNHPNIVTVFDAGQENGQYFITMELLEGTPLDAIVKQRGALPPLVVAQLGVQIATGLHFAHRNKIIHRDIKTANLFLTKDKIVKIMDFGLAKMTEEVRKGATVIGGTPYFMAPEQGDAGAEVDHRADLYALGITLFQLATGSLPFSEGDVAYHHRHTEPPDPREFNADVPAKLADLILHLIQKDPRARVQQAADVVRVLQAMVDEASAGGAQ